MEIEFFIPSLGCHEAAPALYFFQVSKHEHGFKVCYDGENKQAHMESAHLPPHLWRSVEWIKI